MNENFIKVMWQQDENGNPPTGFDVMAQGGVCGSMMAAAIVARSVVSVMEKQVGRAGESRLVGHDPADAGTRR